MRMFLGMFYFPFILRGWVTNILVRLRPWLRTLTTKIADKPVVNLLGGLVDDYQYLWDNYYFSTATL